MTYFIDLARAITSVETAMFNPLINLAAIAILTLICLVIGTFFFARSEKTNNRSLLLVNNYHSWKIRDRKADMVWLRV